MPLNKIGLSYCHREKMNAFRLSCFFGAVLLVCLPGCTPRKNVLDPAELPFRFERVIQAMPWKMYPVDLSGDGRDEYVSIHPESHDAIELSTQDEAIVGEGQVNFEGVVIQKLGIADVNGDGFEDIVVPVLRNDSLFVNFVDNQGKRLGNLFLVRGQARRDEGELIDWDPSIRSFFLEDTNADGTQELITVLSTGRAGMPRGVWVHSLADGCRLDSMLVGANINYTTPLEEGLIIEDVDRDGHLEILFSSSASYNGGIGQNMDDAHSYIGLFELEDSLRVSWKTEMGGRFSNATFASGDFDGDGDEEYLSFTRYSQQRPVEVMMALFDPVTGVIIRQRSWPQPIIDVEAIDLDSDGQDEILVLDKVGNVQVLQGKLERVQQFHYTEKLPYKILYFYILPDVDADGINELLAHTSEGEVLLDRNFNVKAFLPTDGRGGFSHTLRQGTAGVRHFLLARGDLRRTSYRLVPNAEESTVRFGIWLIWAALLVIAITTSGFAARFYVQNRSLKEKLETKTRSLKEQQEKSDDVEKHLTSVKEELISIQEELTFFLTSSKKKHEEVPLVKIRRILDQHFHAKAFSAKKLSDKYEKISSRKSRTFLRDLKKRTGHTRIELIWLRRIEEGADLLLTQQDLTISEVAYEVGFETPQHFSTKFKEVKGDTPSDYRRKNTPSS